MISKTVWAVAIGAASCAAAGARAEDNAPSLLPKSQSRLKPVIVVVAAEMPLFLNDEPAVVKQTVALEPAAAKNPVVQAAGTRAVSEDMGARVVPAWAMPQPAKKATVIPQTNPYVAPRTVR